MRIVKIASRVKPDGFTIADNGIVIIAGKQEIILSTRDLAKIMTLIPSIAISNKELASTTFIAGSMAMSQGFPQDFTAHLAALNEAISAKNGTPPKT